MASQNQIPNKWRNRLLVGGAGVLLTCCCLGYAASQGGRGAANQVQPTQAIQATQGERPTVVESVADTSTPGQTARATNTVNPTRTPRPTATARTPQATFTPVPPSATQGSSPTPAATLAPAFTATEAPPTVAEVQATEAPTLAPAATEPPTVAPPVGDTIALVSLTSPIGAGGDASLVIQTTPGATCFLSYTTPSGTQSGAQGLGATTANGEGRCGWSWRISGSTNPGTGKLFASAGTANASFDIVIQ